MKKFLAALLAASAGFFGAAEVPNDGFVQIPANHPGSCKTNYRGEGRRPGGAYSTVGFRLAAEKIILRQMPCAEPVRCVDE